MGPDEAVRRALTLTGLSYPRGLLGDEAVALADALSAGGADPLRLAALLEAASRAHWHELRPPMAAALARARLPERGEDREALEIARALAERDDPANPLALALAQRAASALAAARRRAVDRLESLAAALDGGRVAGPGAAAALAAATGAIVVDLLDLDAEDFAPEIAAYVEDGQTVEALQAMARATGDLEIREWAREVVAGLKVPGPVSALDAVHGMAAGPLPEDPADDAVWVAAILALAEDAVEIAIAEG
jgi:hypothetical protein